MKFESANDVILEKAVVHKTPKIQQLRDKSAFVITFERLV